MYELDQRSRVVNRGGWERNGMVTRPLGQLRYDVQRGTGYSVSTVAEGQWRRGWLFRALFPTMLRPPDLVTMYDPTDVRPYGPSGAR